MYIYSLVVAALYYPATSIVLTVCSTRRASFSTLILNVNFRLSPPVLLHEWYVPTPIPRIKMQAFADSLAWTLAFV